MIFTKKNLKEKLRFIDRDSKKYIPGSLWFVIYMILATLYTKTMFFLATSHPNLFYEWILWSDIGQMIDNIANSLPQFKDQNIKSTKYNITDLMLIKNVFVVSWLIALSTCYFLFKDINKLSVYLKYQSYKYQDISRNTLFHVRKFFSEMITCFIFIMLIIMELSLNSSIKMLNMPLSLITTPLFLILLFSILGSFRIKCDKTNN